MSILLDVGSSDHARDDDITMPASEFTCLSQETRAELEDSVAQYPDIENKLTRLPQFANADEFFECLWQSLVSSGGRLTPTATGYSTDKVSYEIIIENQRGSTVFGVPMYSNRSLFHPIDPPKFQTLNGHSLGNMGMYPLPGRNSRWSWRSWQVLMINDVDEDGWIYSSFRFGSRRWRGKGG
ncbi:DEKNAAC102396, partial [Brettanomyces naardenensis]